MMLSGNGRKPSCLLHRREETPGSGRSLAERTRTADPAKHPRHTLIADGGVGPHGDSDLSPNESPAAAAGPETPRGDPSARAPRLGVGVGWGGPQPQQHLGAC